MRHTSIASRPAARWLLAGILWLGLASAAQAQPRDRDRVRTELERTDRILEEVRERLQNAADPRALEILQTAQRTEDLGWEHFRGGRFALALQQAVQARELARRALGLVQRPGDAEPRARRLAEQAERAFERAEECAGDPASEQAQRTLDLARARLDETRQALREGKYRLAADIARQVQRLLDPVCGGVPAQQVEQMLENVDRLYERAVPQIASAGAPNALALLDRAHDLLVRAHELQAGREFQMAAQHARQAHELLLRALRLGTRPPDAAQVDRTLEEVASDLDAMTPRVRATGRPEALALLDRAALHLERARELRARERLREALAETRVSLNLTWRAARLAGLRGS